jgi:hypothetical protein
MRVRVWVKFYTREHIWVTRRVEIFYGYGYGMILPDGYVLVAIPSHEPYVTFQRA